MRTIFRTACLLGSIFLFIPSAKLFARDASAGASTSSGQQIKKKKQKKYKPQHKVHAKKLILKGRHERHKGKPA